MAKKIKIDKEAAAIFKALKDSGIKQNKIAEQCNIGVSHLSFVLTGNRVLAKKTRISLLKFIEKRNLGPLYE